jgi:hypothetical protein
MLARAPVVKHKDAKLIGRLVQPNGIQACVSAPQATGQCILRLTPEEA